MKCCQCLMHRKEHQQGRHLASKAQFFGQALGQHGSRLLCVATHPAGAPYSSWPGVIAAQPGKRPACGTQSRVNRQLAEALPPQPSPRLPPSSIHSSGVKPEALLTVPSVCGSTLRSWQVFDDNMATGTWNSRYMPGCTARKYIFVAELLDHLSLQCMPHLTIATSNRLNFTS